MSKASVLRMYAARAETARKRRLRARKSGSELAGHDLADREAFADAGGQVDLVGYLECMSRTATRDTGPEFTGTGPQSRRTLRRAHAAK